MFKAGTVILAAVVLAAVVPAGAQWVQKSNIPNGSLLVGDGTDLFYYSGSAIRKYDAPTDTWATMTAAPVGLGWRNTYVGNEQLVIENDTADLYIYNMSTDTWTTSSPCPVVGTMMYSQGLTYDPTQGKAIYSWSDRAATGQETFKTAAYDIATNTWDPVYDYRPDGGSFSYGTVTEGSKVFTNLTNPGAPVGGLRVYDTSQGGNFGTGAWSSTSTYDMANDNSKYDQLGYPSAATAVFAKMTAIHNGRIYITGSDWSNCFVVYNTYTDTWSYPQVYYPPDIGSYRDHSVQVAGDTLYMRQANELFTIQLLTGDTNDDGVVDVVDLNNVFNNLGTVAFGNVGDTNDDGVVDVVDLNNVFNNLGTVMAVTEVAVPEPGTLAILGLAALALARRKRA